MEHGQVREVLMVSLAVSLIDVDVRLVVLPSRLGVVEVLTGVRGLRNLIRRSSSPCSGLEVCVPMSLRYYIALCCLFDLRDLQRGISCTSLLGLSLFLL